MSVGCRGENYYRALTSFFAFALLGANLDAGQTHISGLVLHQQQADESKGHADHTGDADDAPPAVVQRQQRGDDGTQTPSQVHAAAQNGPPRAKLGRLEPLRWENKGGLFLRSHYKYCCNVFREHFYVHLFLVVVKSRQGYY